MYVYEGFVGLTWGCRVGENIDGCGIRKIKKKSKNKELRLEDGIEGKEEKKRFQHP